jgi:hypothetical protein
MEYTIIKSFGIDMLILQVSCKLLEGWEPVGSAQELQPSPEHPVAGWFFQTMVKRGINVK